MPVELEGIEPSSKQGRPVLSTRLSRTFVFGWRQDPGHRHSPYLLRFHLRRGAATGYPRYCCATWSGGFGATAPEWHLVYAPGAKI